MQQCGTYQKSRFFIVALAMMLLLTGFIAAARAQSGQTEINGKRYIAFARYGENLLDPKGKTIMPVYLVLGESGGHIWGDMLVWTLVDSPIGKRFLMTIHPVLNGILTEERNRIEFETAMQDLEIFDPGKPTYTFNYSACTLIGTLSSGGDIIDLEIPNTNGGQTLRFYRVPPGELDVFGFYFGTTADLNHYFDQDYSHYINSAVAGIVRHPEGGVSLSVACATDEIGGHASAYFDDVDMAKSKNGISFTAENAEGAGFEGELRDGTLSGTVTFSARSVAGAKGRRRAVAAAAYEIKVKYFGDKPGRVVRTLGLLISQYNVGSHSYIGKISTGTEEFSVFIYTTSLKPGHLVQAKFEGQTIPVRWQNANANNLTSDFMVKNFKIPATAHFNPNNVRSNSGGTLEITWINPDGVSATKSLFVSIP